METKQTTDSTTGEDFITLRDIIELFLNKWYYFVISVILCVLMSWIYLASISPMYQRSAVMLVKNEGKAPVGDFSALLELNGMSNDSGVENEIYILRSYQILSEVVQRLRLNMDYTMREGLRQNNLFGKQPFDAFFLDIYPGYTTFQIQVKNEKEYILSDMEIDGESVDFTVSAVFNDTIQTPAGRVILQPIINHLAQYTDKTIGVSYDDLENVTNGVKSRIQTSVMEKKSSLVNIVCQDINISRADAILNMILDVYNETIIEDKNRIATNTAKFIDERITIISGELGDVENKLTTFKQENRLVDISANANMYLQEGSKAKGESLQLESQLSVAEFIKRYIADTTKRNELIPSVSGIGDDAMQSQIESYNTLMLQHNRLVANSGENSPVVKNLNENLNSMRTTIAGSIDNYMRTLRLRFNSAKDVENNINKSIENVPQQEKYALDVMRQQSIKETLYTYLLTKREETAMQLAVTEANIRVVEVPFGSRVPISPKRMNVFIVAFMLGVAIPFAYFLLRELWNTGVHGRKDIENATTLPVLGEIPGQREDNSEEVVVVSENKNDRITEAFRLLRTNLDFMNKDAKVLMFTSTMAGEGKSFVSLNLAVMLSITGKRVILVDTDIRKRTQSKSLGSKCSGGISTYLSGVSSDMESLIIKGHVGDVDFLPAGNIPPNPAELLMNKRLEQMMDTLRKNYDYIIVDNVPALVVADAVIVNRVADITIYIIRDGMLDRRYLPELEALHKEGKFRNMCVVLNDAQDRGGRYGYSCGYGYRHYSETGKQRYASLRMLFLKRFRGWK